MFNQSLSVTKTNELPAYHITAEVKKIELQRAIYDIKDYMS